MMQVTGEPMFQTLRWLGLRPSQKASIHNLHEANCNMIQRDSTRVRAFQQARMSITNVNEVRPQWLFLLSWCVRYGPMTDVELKTWTVEELRMMNIQKRNSCKMEWNLVLVELYWKISNDYGACVSLPFAPSPPLTFTILFFLPNFSPSLCPSPSRPLFSHSCLYIWCSLITFVIIYFNFCFTISSACIRSISSSRILVRSNPKTWFVLSKTWMLPFRSKYYKCVVRAMYLGDTWRES